MDWRMLPSSVDKEQHRKWRLATWQRLGSQSWATGPGRKDRAHHTSSGEDDHRGALGAAMLFDRISHGDEEATVIVVSTIGPLLADRSEVRGDAVIAVNGGSGGNEVDGAGLG